MQEPSSNAALTSNTSYTMEPSSAQGVTHHDSIVAEPLYDGIGPGAVSWLDQAVTFEAAEHSAAAFAPAVQSGMIEDLAACAEAVSTDSKAPASPVLPALETGRLNNVSTPKAVAPLAELMTSHSVGDGKTMAGMNTSASRLQPVVLVHSIRSLGSCNSSFSTVSLASRAP